MRDAPLKPACFAQMLWRGGLRSMRPIASP
jgi:hypothetical protein